ncbi:hypothetical protein D3C86_1942890 [compost metagenome]
MTISRPGLAPTAPLNICSTIARLTMAAEVVTMVKCSANADISGSKAACPSPFESVNRVWINACT